MRNVFVVLILALAACGGDPPDPPLNSNLSGTWTGASTIVIAGYQPMAGPGSLVMAVSGNTATLAGICMDGAGSYSITGAGDEAHWTGTYDCPPYVANACSSEVIEYSVADLKLTGSSLTVTASGSFKGCGVTHAFSMSFLGHKS